MRQAVIDLGTNTFHLLIIEASFDGYQNLFRESQPAKIGKAGINRGVITDEALERALIIMRHFREALDQYQVLNENIATIGTSAVRNAANSSVLIDRIRRETGLVVQVISGDEEADYIYQGVRAAGALDERMALVMDIGGGSVEFILGNQHRIFWKQSFEIGGQRLLERFMNTDPISPATVRQLHSFFQYELLSLANAVHQYAPELLVGSSGSFDTLVDLYYMHQYGQLPDTVQTTFELPRDEFYRSYGLLMAANRQERLQLPGMIELRVDLIVVAVCLIDYVLQSFGILQLRTSTFSLKEGVISSILSRR